MNQILKLESNMNINYKCILLECIPQLIEMNFYFPLKVMKEAEYNKGIDTLLFDGIPNDLGGVSKDAVIRPTGFIDFPEPIPPPEYHAFNYPVI